MAEIQPEYFNELPRYKRLSQFRKYLDSKQYDGLADFFTGQKPGDSKMVPLRERKPCIIYPLPRSAVNQVVRFTFGESRFPTINVEEIDEKKSVAGERLGKENAEELEAFIASLIERCNLKPITRRTMRAGLAVGTTCAIISLKRGCFDIQLANAEDVLPSFVDNDPCAEVTRAVWSYQYEESVPDAQGHPQSTRFWYRQDITDSEFIEYKPAKVEVNQAPRWEVSKRTAHGFGFCPVIWVRNITDADSRSIDGVSLYDNLLEEFDALNLALSQRHRGINFFGVPQPWETGVEEDDGPAATGRRSRHGYSPAGTQSPHGAVAGEGGDDAPARPISPQNMWTYRGEKAAVGLLETTGKAFEAGTNHVNDIRSRALEAMSVVLVNVSEVMNRTAQNQMSAKFLELAYEPLLALVDEMRHCWWPYGLKAILSALLRIVAVRDGKGIYVPGAAEAAKILKPFFVKTDAGEIWLAPSMVPSWGDYFSAGPDEIGKAVETATKAKEAQLVPKADASKFVLEYFGREDLNEAIDEIEDEVALADEMQRQADEAAQKSELKKMHDLSKGLVEEDEEPSEDEPDGDDEDDEPDAGAGARGRKKPSSAN